MLKAEVCNRWISIYIHIVFVLKGVQMTTRKRLCNIKGISEAKMEKIKEACTKIAGVCCDKFYCYQFQYYRTRIPFLFLKVFAISSQFRCSYHCYTKCYILYENGYIETLPFQEGGFCTALEFADKRKAVFKLSTGSSELE